MDAGTRVYLRSRARHRLFEFILRAFVKSNLKQSELATMLGWDQGRVSKLLSAPANWEADTVTDLFAAITLGKEMVYAEATSPYDKPARNDVGQSIFAPPSNNEVRVRIFPNAHIDRATKITVSNASANAS